MDRADVESSRPLIECDGVAIRALRRQLGLTQNEFARQIGIARETLSRLENLKWAPTRGVRRRFYEIWEVEQARRQRLQDPRHRAVIARLNL